MNVLIPMSGSRLFEKSQGFEYPKILTEVNGKTLLEHALQPFTDCNMSLKLILAIPSNERKTHALDDIVNVVSNGNAIVLDVPGETGGALCTCLLAVDRLDLDDELVVSSADHFLNGSIDETVAYFRTNNADAGVITFESVHPKWSYVVLDDQGLAIQTSEKKPISRNAMTGLFYFKTGWQFIEAAKNVIRKQSQVNGSYFISSAINEMILDDARIVAKKIEKTDYYSFYDAHSIGHFEKVMNAAETDNEYAITSYMECIAQEDVDKILSLFGRESFVVDGARELIGLDMIRSYYMDLFEKSNGSVNCVDCISSNGQLSVIQYKYMQNDIVTNRIDILRWQKNIVFSMNTYLIAE